MNRGHSDEKSTEENETKIHVALEQDATLKSVKGKPILGEDTDDDVEVHNAKCGQRVELTSVPTIQAVLKALQEQLHSKNVTHGGLTPEHILYGEDSDEEGKQILIFFSGLADPCEPHPNNLTPSIADASAAAKWGSFDAMLDRTVHELDDYEAVFTSALLETSGLLKKGNRFLR